MPRQQALRCEQIPRIPRANAIHQSLRGPLHPLPLVSPSRATFPFPFLPHHVPLLVSSHSRVTFNPLHPLLLPLHLPLLLPTANLHPRLFQPIQDLSAVPLPSNFCRQSSSGNPPKQLSSFRRSDTDVHVVLSHVRPFRNSTWGPLPTG